MSDDLKQKRTSKSAYLNEINRYIALFHLDPGPSFYRFNMFVYFTPCVRVLMRTCRGVYQGASGASMDAPGVGL